MKPFIIPHLIVDYGRLFDVAGPIWRKCENIVMNYLPMKHSRLAWRQRFRWQHQRLWSHHRSSMLTVISS